MWRNPRRSGVTVAAMTLALFVLILYAGLVRGYMRDMEANIVELEIGDLQLVAPGEDALMPQGSGLTSVHQRHCLIDDGL